MTAVAIAAAVFYAFRGKRAAAAEEEPTAADRATRGERRGGALSEGRARSAGTGPDLSVGPLGGSGLLTG